MRVCELSVDYLYIEEGAGAITRSSARYHRVLGLSSARTSVNCELTDMDAKTVIAGCVIYPILVRD